VVQEPVEGIENAGLTWALVAEIDESEVLEPAREQQRSTLLVTAIAGLLAAGVAVAIAFITSRQVNEVQQVFDDVRIGEFQTRARIYSKDELGQLADGVNSLLDLLTDLLTEAETNLAERVKELTALHEVSRIVQEGRASTAELLADVAELLPSAWQYPDITAGRVAFGAHDVQTPNFARTRWMLRAPFETSDGTRGVIEVAYLEERPEAAEGPFLQEERDLINSLAETLRAYFDRQYAETERTRLFALMARQTAILDNLNDFAGYASLETGQTLYLNEAGLRMVGREGADFTQLVIPDFHSPAAIKLVNEEGIPTMIEHGTWSGESEIMRKDGAIVPVHQTLVLIRDDDGNPFAAGTIMRDITEQKQRQAEIEQILNTAADGMRLIDVNFDVVRANSPMAAMTGVSMRETLHAKCYDTFGSDLCNSEDCTLKRILRGDTYIQGEVEKIRPDGSTVPTIITATPFYGPTGEIIGVVEDFRDISERKEAEAQREELMEQMSRQTAILDNLNDFAGYATLEGEIVYINQAGQDMVGYDLQTTQVNVNDLYPTEERRKVHEEYLPTAMRDGIWSGETVIQRRDGTRIPVHQVYVLIWDKVGEPQATGTIIRDISDQRSIITSVEQAAAQVTNASESMTDVIQMMVDQATQSAEVAEQAANQAQEGDQAVHQTVAAMQRIRDNTQETARRIKRLGEVSQEISEVVRFIEELSDRTTVLALNASIQAAAAGEAGRGFAVVAEEVQRLAERAAGATREIENLVKSIQSETNEAVVSIEESTREVVDGSLLAQQAGDRMSELSHLVNRMVTLIQESSETTATQTSASMETLTGLLRGLQHSVAAFGLSSGNGAGNGHSTDDHATLMGDGRAHRSQ
ncbi:MAG: PAS domain S-box protein, partial [Chloroflexi bacterium]|nr:PAS domain S-box protein [Chloroflexota bacterium]